MSLHVIVAALGGDLYHGGWRANVPAPGHSSDDRSVSLLLSDGRVIIHGFGGADWRSVRDVLRRDGFIDADGRLTGSGRSHLAPQRPDRRLRVETAVRLWLGARPIEPGDPASRHLAWRSVQAGDRALGLRFHRTLPVSVYRAASRSRPALVARISDVEDRLTGVEITYLEPNGRPAAGLTLARKTVGLVAPGAAVRLTVPAAEMLVGEGVVTTLSAMERFQRPGWALMSANNLAVWTPPPAVQDLLIAADRGEVGQGAALRLRHRLTAMGIRVQVRWPDDPFGDWNEVAVAARQREERGR